MLIAIDPGADSGWAVFYDNVLVSCGLNGEPAPVPAQVDLVVIERPKVYPGGRTKSPDAIVTLALNAGEWAGRFRAHAFDVRYVEPRTWKGTVDGDVCTRRILKALSSGERDAYEDAMRLDKVPSKKKHNVVDAIGIGLWACDRFGR